MAISKYLYKNTDGEWIFGGMKVIEGTPVIDNEIKGQGEFIRYIKGSGVGFQYKDNSGFRVQLTPYSEFAKDSSATPYASITEFKELTKEFFAGGNPITKQKKLTLEITRPANVLDYAANDVINSVIASAKKKETVTLGGTEGTVNLSIPNIANRTVAFTDTLDATAALFVTDYAADFLPLIVVTASTNTIIFEAATAGVDFEDVVKAVTGDMTATIEHTVANALLSMPVFVGDAVAEKGGSCMITSAFIEAPAKFASATMTLRLYNDISTTILGDNVAFVLNATDALIRNGYIDIELGAVVNAATVVSGMTVPFLTFKAADNSTAMYATLIVGGAIVAPESAGKFTITLNVTQL